MKNPVIAFFNNKGGVGKTSLVFHLAAMYADVGRRVLAVDLDPQANLTGMFLDDDDLDEIWPDEPAERKSILGVVHPLIAGTGDVGKPALREWGDNVGLLPGDIGLSQFEDALAEAWPKCFGGDERSFRVLSAFHRSLKLAEADFGADLTLVDVGPNLGAINRASLITSTHFAVPLGPDLFSLQGLRNLGPIIRKWRKDWEEMRVKAPLSPELLPEGRIEPVGYIMMRHSIRRHRPVLAYKRWMDKMPAEYAKSVLGEEATSERGFDGDPHFLAHLKDYRSLMPMAQESGKPMFKLTPADGAFGGHQSSVTACYRDFRKLAAEIAEKAGFQLP